CSEQQDRFRDGSAPSGSHALSTWRPQAHVRDDGYGEVVTDRPPCAELDLRGRRGEVAMEVLDCPSSPERGDEVTGGSTDRGAIPQRCLRDGLRASDGGGPSP